MSVVKLLIKIVYIEMLDFLIIISWKPMLLGYKLLGKDQFRHKKTNTVKIENTNRSI